MKKAFLIVVAMLIVSVASNLWLWQNQPKPSVVIERDTVWKDTTIYEPQPTETVQTGRVVYIKVPVLGELDTITLHDSIDVQVPIVQKRYDDSLYTAWVSGYRPSLDSIRLYQPEIVTTVTTTVVKPTPLITFGIQAGGGYGIINRKPDIYVGVGAQLNLWRK